MDAVCKLIKIVFTRIAVHSQLQ